ncbi:MAG: hypothetical protein NE334_16765 [Lentisphaeraceae bacterium]|nr:hypothetical protein [Lentisphaeraceae bacterium]
MYKVNVFQVMCLWMVISSMLLNAADKPTKVKIDRDKRILIVNNKAFFPIGIMGGFIENLPEIADAGFNLTMRWRGATTYNRVDTKKPVSDEQNQKAVLTYLDAVHKAGLYALETPVKLSDVYMKFRDKEWEKKYPAINNKVTPLVIEIAKKHPADIGYYNYDEPDNFYPDDPIDSPRRLLQQEGVEKWYKKVKELDPGHPVLTLFAVGLKKVKDWNAWDIGCTDHYPMEDHHLIDVYKHAKESDEIAKEKGTPYVFTPLFEKSSGRLRPMNASEQRAQTYLALIGGAKGIMWWEWPASYLPNWLEIKKLIPEIKTMAPYLMENSPLQEMVYKDPETQDTLKVLLKKKGNKVLLVCANASTRPIQYVLSSPFFKYLRNAKSLFDNQRVKTSRGAIVDSLSGHSTKVYEFSISTFKKLSKTKPIQLNLNIKMGSNKLPVSLKFKAGKKNLVLNSSIEHSYSETPGWPAHWGQATSIMTSGDVGNPKGNWIIDSSQKHHGKHSIRIIKTAPGIAGSTQAFTFCEAPAIEQAVNHPSSGKFTYSVYLKAKKPVRAWLMAGWGDPKQIEVGKKWQRYELTYDKKSSGNQTVRVILLQEGTLWADSFQVESGNEATDFEYVEPVR